MALTNILLLRVLQERPQGSRMYVNVFDTSCFGCGAASSMTMDMDMVSSSCDRLSKTRGEIFFGGKQRYNTTTCIDSEVFVRMVARQSRHWLRFVQGYNWLLRATYSVEELKKLARITRRLNTPFLSELDIRFPSVILMEDRHRRQDVRDAVHYYSTWSMPKLRSLVMENLLPIPCFAPVSLTNLDITLNFEGYMRC